MNRLKVWFHADDYGVTKEQAERILYCHTNGVLNSISILPNTGMLDETFEILERTDPKHSIRRVLHLNFVEGKPMASGKTVDMLIDDEGYFNISFVKLLLWNYLKTGKNREKLKKQLRTEIGAQLDAVTINNDFHISAVDSHQHYHMIPVVCEALIEVLREKGRLGTGNDCIRQLRIPVDPLMPVFTTRGILHRIPAVNWIKWFILHINEKKCRAMAYDAGLEMPVFFGIFFTCSMRRDIVGRLLSVYETYAEKRNAELELMFHPGNLNAGYELLDIRKKNLEEFYLSDNRFYEAETLIRLKEEGKNGVNYEK